MQILKILFILHAHFELPGYIETWAKEKGFEVSYVSPFEGESLSKYDGKVDLIVSMGGPQSAAFDLEKYDYLNKEITFLRKALDANTPVLGFCLGAQLIGAALGARTEKSPYKEIGFYPITLTEQGLEDPLLQGLPKSFLVTHWHGDMPGLTKEAQVLASSEGCPRQILKYLPHAYGFQCHPEMTLQNAQEMIKNCTDDFIPEKYIQTPEGILSQDFYALNHGHIMQILNNFLPVVMKGSKKIK